MRFKRCIYKMIIDTDDNRFVFFSVSSAVAAGPKLKHQQQQQKASIGRDQLNTRIVGYTQSASSAYHTTTAAHQMPSSEL